VFHGLGCPGDEFVVSAPYFPEYKVFIEGAGCAMKLALPQPGTLQLDPAALEAVITSHTKGLVVNSPNNPSGVIYTKENLEAVAALLERKSQEYGHPIYLIADEPYREIVFGDNVVSWLPSVYRDTIVCYSFSKSLSLPGERLGYVFVPGDCADHDDVYAAVAGAGRMLGYVCAPSLFQRVCAACCSLTSDTSVYARNAQLLVTSLRAMGYDCVEPQGAFYLFLKTLEPDDLAFSEQAKALDLLLVPGSGFGMSGYVRLAFCVQTEMIEKSLPKFQLLADSYR
jgi:aspartate aminotransferase